MSDENTNETENKSKLQFALAFPYNIQIEPTVNGGVLVRVGCAQLTYENTNKMLKALKQYFADPEAAEKAYNACNALKAGPEAPRPTTRPGAIYTNAPAPGRRLGAGANPVPERGPNMDGSQVDYAGNTRDPEGTDELIDHTERAEGEQAEETDFSSGL